MTGFWRIVSPKTRKQLYTTIATDAYDPRKGDGSSFTALTWYSQIMRGPGTRMTSYKQYDAMDSDIDIARALDIIAEEMSSKDEKTDLPFIVNWQKEDNQNIDDTALITIRSALRQWSLLQDLKKRIFSTSRCMAKYGDCFFRKTSDTKKWIYVDPSLVSGIEIDEHGNKVAYHVKKPFTGNSMLRSVNETTDIVPAAAMIHFSMCDDMGDSAPFGQSVLKPIFRVYRQLSMIEDAVIIYRIVRAPERRVFYVDVGNMNQQQVKRYLNSVKDEIRQRRVPGMQANGNKDVVDGAYDPNSLGEDYFMPVTAAGKGSRVETLPGGTEDFGVNLLKHFTDKMFRGLRIPNSYISGDGAGVTNDGKVGIAYIEEMRFANFICRLQDRLNEIYDAEFKIYLKVCGVQVDSELFKISLPDPANFALYKQSALDAELINTFQNVSDIEYLSKKFVLKRYLGLSDDEIQMNEILLKAEKNVLKDSDITVDQQLYDSAVYKNREAITVKLEEPPEEELQNSVDDSEENPEEPDNSEKDVEESGESDNSEEEPKKKSSKKSDKEPGEIEEPEEESDVPISTDKFDDAPFKK